MSARSSSVTQERWRNSISGTSGSSRSRARARARPAPRRLLDARVVLEQDAAQLARRLERRRAPRGSRGTPARLRLAVAGHLAARLDVEDEVVRRPLGPASRRVSGAGSAVERRVDLDDVEALGVVAQPGLGARHAARVPVLDEPLVGPAAGADADRRRHVPQPTIRPWISRPVGVFDSGGRAHRPPRVPRHDAARGLRLPRRRRAAARTGPRPLDEIRRFAREIAGYLEGQGVKLSSPPATRRPRPRCPSCSERSSVPVVGVITPEAHAAVQATRNRRVGLLATQATVASGRYEELSGRSTPACASSPVACPRLVPLIESDDPFGEATIDGRARVRRAAQGARASTPSSSAARTTR